jgi:hypothetical protein
MATYKQKTLHELKFSWIQNECNYGTFSTFYQSSFIGIVDKFRYQSAAGPVVSAAAQPQNISPLTFNIFQSIDMTNNTLLPVLLDLYCVTYKQGNENPLVGLGTDTTYLTSGTTTAVNVLMFPTDYPHWVQGFRVEKHKQIRLPAGGKYVMSYTTQIKWDPSHKGATSTDILPDKTFGWLVRGQGEQAVNLANNTPGYAPGSASGIIKTVTKVKYDGDGVKTLQTGNNLSVNVIDTETGAAAVDNK